MRETKKRPMAMIPCAVCQNSDYRVKYPEYIEASEIDFSARRAPSKTHYRIVQCNRCGLIYSNPVFTNDQIIRLYKDCSFAHEKQVELMGQDYLDQLKRALLFVDEREKLLEIGCGNGYFLKKAKEAGFKNVYGVEPCKDAVNQADLAVRKNIINDVFQDGMYQEHSFDLVCVIHVFDHLMSPDEVLRTIRKILKPKGYILAMSHNVRFLLTKTLGERSPMYDIEHIYLFDKRTLSNLLHKNGFKVLYVRDMLSRYTLAHAVKMFPLPAFLKNSLLELFNRLNVAEKKFKIIGGNMVALARKSD